MSLVSVARLGCGRGSDRFRTRPAAAIEACEQASFIGPAILRGTLPSTLASAARPEARRADLAHVACCAAVFVASAIPHPTSMLDRLCFTWTRLRSMDRPSVVMRIASARYESNAYAPNPLFLVSCMAVNKKQPFRRMRDEKTSRKAQCDASKTHKRRRDIMSRRRFQQERIVQPRLSIGTKRRFSGPV